MEDRSTFVWNRLEQYAKTKGVEIVEKESSTLMKLAGFFSYLWNPNFMKTTTTQMSIGSVRRIYMPKALMRTFSGWATLGHELVHAEEAEKHTIFFRAMYFFPQILAVFGLLGFLGILWPWAYSFFVFIFLFLAPIIPAQWRIDWEKPAMAMSVALADLEYAAAGLPTNLGLAQAKAESMLGRVYLWPALVRGKAYQKELEADLRQRALLLIQSRHPIYEVARLAIWEHSQDALDEL